DSDSDSAIDRDTDTQTDKQTHTQSERLVTWEDGLLTASFDGPSTSAEFALNSERLGSIRGSLSKQDRRTLGRLQTQGLKITQLRDLVPEFAIQSGLAVADLNFELSSLTANQSLMHGDEASEDESNLTGRFQISDLSIRIPGTETPLEQFNVSGRTADGRLSFEGDGVLGGGSVVTTGSCCEQQRLRLSLSGTDTRIQLDNGANAQASSEILIQLGAGNADLSGSFKVHEGTLPLARSSKGGIALSDDIQEVEDTRGGPTRFEFKSEIELELEPGFTLRSKELELTLSGRLRARTEPLAPAQVFGDLQVLGGELRAFGQSLRVAEGTISFLGDASNPGLDLRAERTIRGENLRVGVRVTGTVNEPVLDLYSDPVRPERDVLSYLLRGRGPDVGAGADGTAMALSLGATALNQLGALGALNAIPGLSQVQLSAEGQQGDTQATISGYVGERLYLSYGVGIYEPVNALTARLYLQSRLWLEVVSRLESSLDLYYRFDIAARQSPQGR
ncbi:MAG: translocation/assembly module TamB domain-containing protein, partial [Pseudomonadota bacterium]